VQLSRNKKITFFRGVPGAPGLYRKKKKKNTKKQPDSGRVGKALAINKKTSFTQGILKGKEKKKKRKFKKHKLTSETQKSQDLKTFHGGGTQRPMDRLS